MNDTTYIVILDWMLELNLSIVERTIYAIIYGFSQRNMGKFTGSRAYLASWCSCTTRTVDTALAKLVSVGLLNKEEYYESGVKLCRYTANIPQRKNFSGSEKISPVAKKFPKGSEIISHNNEVDKSTSNSNNIESETRTHAREEGKKFDFYSSLLELGISEQAASDWMLVRKNAKATNTETAFNALRNQIDKICRRYGVTPDQVARFAASHDWKGINADWEAVKNIKKDADHSADNDEDSELPF